MISAKDRRLELSQLATRVQATAEEHDPELSRILELHELTLASSRPLDAATDKRLGVSLRLALLPRALGQVLASASLQDRLTTVVATAVGETEGVLLLDLTFGCVHTRGRVHPYRVGPTLPEEPVVFDVAGAVREVVEGYFSGLSDPPRVDVSAYGDEVVIAIDAPTLIFRQLAPTLRDAALRVTPKVLVHRLR